MMDLFILIIIYALGLGMGLMFMILMKSAKEDREAFNHALAVKKLQRHELRVAITMDRYVDDPEKTVERVKEEFARELYKIIDDKIEVEKDRYSNHIKFSVDVWTKEAVDGKSQV